ncbi:hypothetical protein Q604_UNBC10655G0001, partial [human gut metagenome]
YDDTLKSDNVYTALTTKSTICQGYAMTVYKMLNIIFFIIIIIKIFCFIQKII